LEAVKALDYLIKWHEIESFIVKRFLASLFVLFVVTVSFGQGTFPGQSEFLLALEEQPSEQTFRDLTRHVRLTLPGTYFTGPIGRGGDNLGVIGFILPGVVFDDVSITSPGFVTFPGNNIEGRLISTREFLLGAETVTLASQPSGFQLFTRGNGGLPPLPRVPRGDDQQDFFEPNLLFVKMPGGRMARVVGVTEFADSISSAPVTVPEPASILLLSLIGTGCWFFRRRA
jgi:hypothetical protein